MRGPVLRNIRKEETVSLIKGIEMTRVTYRSPWGDREFSIIDTTSYVSDKDVEKYYFFRHNRRPGMRGCRLAVGDIIFGSFEEAHRGVLRAMNAFRHNFFLTVRYSDEANVLHSYIVMDGKVRRTLRGIPVEDEKRLLDTLFQMFEKAEAQDASA